MSEQIALSRIQSIIDELDRQLADIAKLTTLTDQDIDNMLDADTPDQAKLPPETKTQQALAYSTAAEDAVNIQQTTQMIQQAADTWLNYIENESSRALATATATPNITAPETKIVQHVTTIKPPPELPDPWATWLTDISYILYSYIISGLLGEIEIKPIDLDRYIDDFLKICDIVIRVKISATGQS